MNIKILLAVGITLLFTGTVFTLSITASEPTSNQTFYSDDGGADYTRIQDAVLIDNSMEQKEINPNEAELFPTNNFKTGVMKFFLP